jgi:hypothetical protein
MLLWAAVPWLWRQPWPPWWLLPREIAARLRGPRPHLVDIVRGFFGRWPFREPSPAEEELLTRLGRAAGLPPDWLRGLQVAEMDDGGMGSLRLRPPLIGGRDKDPGRVVAEYGYVDADGVNVLVSLFVDNEGQPLELDSWKVDFRPIISRSGPEIEDPFGRTS